jgi:uncharacterized protein YcaQ
MSRDDAVPIAIDDLRRFAVVRSLFPPTSLPQAVERLGFIQADPIRAPARAQDLTLRHRVRGYRAGDLERRYAALGIAEDFFVNYGFVTGAVQRLMHPRSRGSGQQAPREKAAVALLAFVRSRGEVHPRHLVEHFEPKSVRNYWGGSSAATTHLLDALHYQGLLRVTRREAGIRLYAVHEHPPRQDAGVRDAHIDALVDVVVNCYAPLPAATLTTLVARLRYAVPQWRQYLKAAVVRARGRLAHARAGDVDWYWPAGERMPRRPAPASVRFLAPFDPVVWDRARFELLWGWRYRFEAYTPAAKRKLGYYALPMLWQDRVIGWGTFSIESGRLQPRIGYVRSRPPADRGFRAALDEEIDRFARFLGLKGG